MRIIICDDNNKELELYSSYIKKFLLEQNINAQVLLYSGSSQLLFDLEDIKDSIDTIFLDINMPKINGIEVAKKVRELGCVSDIIFLTASKDYMLDAFDVGASNYIVKGETSDERFHRIIMKSLDKAKDRKQEYLLVTGGGEHHQIPISSILYFELKNRIITVNYGDQSFEFFSNLNKIEERLNNMGFFRIHRSFLVSVSKIVSIAYRSRGEVTMSDGAILPVGRTQYAELKNLIKKR